jgi:hypothetical protein
LELFSERGEKMAKKTVIVRRNAVDGKFVSPEYVKKHPNTTETERRPTKKK